MRSGARPTRWFAYAGVQVDILSVTAENYASHPHYLGGVCRVGLVRLAHT